MAAEVVDVAVEGGREEHRLAGGGEPAQDPLDLGHEAHVGHPVGLVEDDELDACPDVEVAALAEVDEPAGRGDDDVDALAQRLDLALHRGAAVDGDDPLADGLGQRGEHVVDLEGELAGGHEDEAAGLAGRPGRRPAGAGAGRRRGSCPSRSWPCRRRRGPSRAGGMHRAWTGKGRSMPWAARAAVSAGGRPSSAKDRSTDASVAEVKVTGWLSSGVVESGRPTQHRQAR